MQYVFICVYKTMLKNSPIRYVEEKDLGFHEHFLDLYLELVFSHFYELHTQSKGNFNFVT